jgi:hypothetical protein
LIVDAHFVTEHQEVVCQQGQSVLEEGSQDSTEYGYDTFWTAAEDYNQQAATDEATHCEGFLGFQMIPEHHQWQGSLRCGESRPD